MRYAVAMVIWQWLEPSSQLLVGFVCERASEKERERDCVTVCVFVCVHACIDAASVLCSPFQSSE